MDEQLKFIRDSPRSRYARSPQMVEQGSLDMSTDEGGNLSQELLWRYRQHRPRSLPASAQNAAAEWSFVYR